MVEKASWSKGQIQKKISTEIDEGKTKKEKTTTIGNDGDLQSLGID